MRDITVNRFRQKRGIRLREMIAEEAARLGRPLEVLDVGGRPDYWLNVQPMGVAVIKLLNLTTGEMEGRRTVPELSFENIVGDACDLSEFADGSVDFVHSNSVIEHVGNWSQIQRMARELRRVGQSGWVQTPAFEFPIEPHWRLPLIHWLALPVQCAVLRARYGLDRTLSRESAEGINLLTRKDFDALFPNANVFVERFLALAKSYVATWRA